MTQRAANKEGEGKGNSQGQTFAEPRGACGCEVRLVIPLEPPSGNHYKKVRHIEGHGLGWYHTKEAKAWFEAVKAIFPASAMLITENHFIHCGLQHEVEYTVYQGHGSRGDVDNYAKVILDGLVRAGVLRSDATVVDLICHKRRDRENPRTEIIVRSLPKL